MRTSIEGRRHYEITGKKLPSVTTILGATQSEEKKASLARWQAKVGELQADRVRDQAASRGTNMHNHLEKYVLGQGHLDLTDEGKEWIDDYFMQLGAYAMAHNQVYDTEITQGVILMCTPDNYFQKFQVKGKEFISYQHKFLERVDKYYNDSKLPK